VCASSLSSKDISNDTGTLVTIDSLRDITPESRLSQAG